MARLYVGNLHFEASEADLREVFRERAGIEPDRAHIARDDYGKSCGFAFVKMKNKDSAKLAIQTLANTAFRGRQLIVRLARPASARGRQYLAGKR